MCVCERGGGGGGGGVRAGSICAPAHVCINACMHALVVRCRPLYMYICLVP